MKTVVVTWMDGKQEVYTCGKDLVGNGFLELRPSRYPATGDDRVKVIPLDNVRIYTVDGTES
jgi:hypothetical protein